MSEQRKPSVVQSLRKYARGITGGLMFSLPLLNTIESGSAPRGYNTSLTTCFLLPSATVPALLSESQEREGKSLMSQIDLRNPPNEMPGLVAEQAASKHLTGCRDEA